MLLWQKNIFSSYFIKEMPQFCPQLVSWSYHLLNCNLYLNSWWQTWHSHFYMLYPKTENSSPNWIFGFSCVIQEWFLEIVGIFFLKKIKIKIKRQWFWHKVFCVQKSHCQKNRNQKCKQLPASNIAYKKLTLWSQALLKLNHIGFVGKQQQQTHFVSN